MALRRAGINLFKALLHLYPREFRQEYGAEMERFFADRLHAEPCGRVWASTLADAATVAPREHINILFRDLSYALRTMRAAPGFTLVALLTIAIGIGASTAVFSLMNAVLLRSLPYEDPARLVYVWTPNSRFKPPVPKELPPSAADFYDWQRLSSSFTELALFTQAAFNLSETGDMPVRVGGVRVTGNFFHVLGARAELGRLIGPDDDQPGRQNVVVIAHNLWQSGFAGSSNVVGQTLRVNGRPFQIVGVMPPEFVYPRDSDLPKLFANTGTSLVWTPLAWTPEQRADRTVNRDGTVVARLRPGVSIAQAETEMASIMQRLDMLQPAQQRGWGAMVTSFLESAIGEVRPQIRLLFGAVLVVLLIACGNVANLLMARAAARVHEFGVRSAMGAGRARLIRQLVTEAVLLATAGGALGMLIAVAAMRLLVKLNPGDIPRLEQTSLDWRVLLFGVAISLATGTIFGLLPAASASRIDVRDLLNRGGNRGALGAAFRVRQILIANEVALALILLAGSGLLIRSYLRLQSDGAGFAPSTMAARLWLTPRYRTDGQRTNAFRELVTRLNAIPGARSAGAVTDLPLSHSESLAFVEVEGVPVERDQLADRRAASPRYFESMGMRILEGRAFTDSDAQGREPVAVVSQSFAARYFAGQSALGHRTRWMHPDGRHEPWKTIVGVVSDVRHTTLEEPPRPHVYDSLWQPVDQQQAYSVYLSVRGDPSLASAIRAAVRDMDATLALDTLRTMDDRIVVAGARRRFQTSLLGGFAVVAVVLAMVGLYGLVAYSVRVRTAEIGVRMALGARSGPVVRMVVRQGWRLAIAGIAVGLAGAFLLTRFVASWLYGVTPYDAVTFFGTPLLLLLVALAACLIPAWRATRIDPMTALRRE